MNFTLLIVIIALAFLFDFINGFHDAANSIATIVSTKVLTPFQAVLWAAFFNFLAYAIFELKIALVGGFAGAAIAHAGWGVVHSEKIIKIASFIFLAPILGMIISYFISVLLLNVLQKGNPHILDKYFKQLQLFSSALFSLGHGGNDAQKVMGIIAATLMVYFHGVDPSAIPSWAHITLNDAGKIHAIPHWVVFGCYAAIGAGTLSGGWRIVKTMGTKITKLTPFEGVAAETAGALLLFGTDAFGIPVSTTHTITGAIMGTGLTKRITAVRWGVTINLMYAWILTIPVSMGIAALVYYLFVWMGYN
jgi:PiT family inorganic phosphate transporter